MSAPREDDSISITHFTRAVSAARRPAEHGLKIKRLRRRRLRYKNGFMIGFQRLISRT